MLAIALCVVAIVIQVYRPGLSGPFLLDDHGSLVLLSEDDRSPGAWLERLRQAPAHVRQRVVSNLSFMTNQAMAGAWTSHAPFPFKLGNLLIHLLCAAGAMAMAYRVALLAGATGHRALWTGVLTAALFALHPLQVSTTLYVVQRMAQLSALFSILAVLAYIRWRLDIARVSDVRNVANLALVPLFAGLAFLSKENGALVPLYLVVIELCFFRFPLGVFRPMPADAAIDTSVGAVMTVPSPEVKSRFEMGFGLLAAGPVLAALIALPFFWSRLAEGYALRDFTLVERVLTQIHAIWHYIGLMVWPRVGAMGLYRDDFPLTSALELSTLLLGAALVVLGVAAVLLRRRAPVIAFAILWFFTCHAMESTLLPLELVFEHRNYLALLGPATALAYLLAHWRRPPWLAPCLAAALLLVLAALTQVRAYSWSSYETWLVAESSNRPASLRAGTDLILLRLTQDRAEAALDVLRGMEQVRSDSAHPSIVAIMLRCFGVEPPLPLQSLVERVRTLELPKDSFHLFGVVMERKQAARCQGVTWYDLAQIAGSAAANPGIRRHPDSESAWRRNEARAFLFAEDWTRAQDSLEAVLSLRDDDPRDWLALAEARLRSGDIDGFRQARAGLLALWPRPEGQLAEQLRVLDSAAAKASRPTR